MFGGIKKNASMASQPNILKAMRVQTSTFGQVIPIVYGLNRLAGSLIWYGDFTPIQHTSPVATGGKGGGSTHVQSQVTYTYQAAVAILLCEGPVAGLISLWDTKANQTQLTQSDMVSIPGSPYQVQSSQASFAQDLGVAFVQTYTDTYNDYGSDGPRTVTGTNYVPLVRVPSSPATGQYSVNGTGLYTFAAADTGLQVRITYSYAGTNVPLQSYNLTLFVGKQGQSPWGYLTTNHSGQDLGYTALAYVASPNMDLGETGEMPNLNYEVLGLKPFGGGSGDANPADVITDVLTSTLHGVNFPIANIGDLTQYSNYALAYDLLISPILDQQDTAANWVSSWLRATNSDALFSEGKLKIIPYGDESQRGNGVLYTPATSPIVDLDLDDFKCTPGQEPLLVTLPTYADANNCQKVEFFNRANAYNPEPVEDKDEGMIALYGLREANLETFHFLTTQKRAALAANFLTKRAIYIDSGAQYTFTLGAEYIYLEPGDLVTALTPDGLVVPIRLTQVVEDDKGDLACQAEGFPFGTATATLYPKQNANGFGPQYDSDPGDTNAPIIFEVPNRQNMYAGYELLLGLSGASPNWGGCRIWISRDGVSFKQLEPISIFSSRSRMGVTTADLPPASDPDTTNTLSVDVTESIATLSGGTQADCDNDTLLCWVGAKTAVGTVTVSGGGLTVTWATGDQFDADWGNVPIAAIMINGVAYPIAPQGVSSTTVLTLASPATNGTWAYSVISSKGELISFEVATLTSAYHYDLKTRLRRGVYGTGRDAAFYTGAGWDHPAGSTFLRVDDAVFTFTYDMSLAGQTVYLKFTSFNQFGRREQSLATVKAYAFQIPGLNTGIKTGTIKIFNGDFEKSNSMDSVTGAPPGWQPVGSPTPTLAYDTTTPLDGTRSLIINGTGGIIGNDLWEASPSELLRAIMLAKKISGAGNPFAAAVVQFYNFDGVNLGSQVLAETNSTSPVTVSLIGAAPLGTAYCRISSYPFGALLGMVFEVDDFVIERRSPVSSSTAGLQKLDSGSGTYTWDTSQSSSIELSLTADTTLVVTNLKPGPLWITIIPNGHLFTWPSQAVGTQTINSSALSCTQAFIYDGTSLLPTAPLMEII